MSSTRILFIEDDPGIRATVADILIGEGYAVDTAANGQEALDKLRAASELPVLILLDLMMPVMNGWQFSAVQRVDPKLAGIPVVVISASTNIQQSAASIGATGFLKKPIGLDALLEIVAEASKRGPIGTPNAPGSVGTPHTPVTS